MSAIPTVASKFPLFCVKATAILSIPVFLTLAAVNLWLDRNLPVLVSAVGIALDRPVVMERACFNPFRGFLVYGVELPKHGTMAPVSISTVRIFPSLDFRPAPALVVRRVIFEKPHFSVSGKAEDLFQIGAKLKNLPEIRGKIGALDVCMKLASFEISGGKVTLLSAGKGGAWRQDFEGVDFFAGRSYFKQNVVKLKGHIAGKPEAKFAIECALRNDIPRRLDSNIRVDFRQFTTAYLNRHLDGKIQLPGDALTASVKLKIRKGNRLELRGKIVPPKAWFGAQFPEVLFFLQGVWDNSRIRFTSVSLKGAGVKLGGAGEVFFLKNAAKYRFLLSSDLISLKRFGGIFKTVAIESGQVEFVAELKGDQKSFDPALDVVFHNGAFRELKQDLSVTNMEGRVVFSKDYWKVKELWAFVNNLPIGLNAEARWTRPARVHFDVSTYPGQIPKLRARNPVNAAVKGAAVLLKDGWSGHARVMLSDFPKGVEQKRTWTVLVGGLSLSRQMNARQVCRKFQVLSREGGFSAERLLFSVAVDRTRLQAEIFDAILAGGKLRASASASPADRTWQATASVAGADLKGLLEAAQKKWPVTGRLSASASWKGGPRDFSEGHVRLKISNGRIGPGALLTRWANETDIEALKEIPYHFIESEAVYSAGQWDLKNVRLDADSIVLASRFKLKGSRVSGTLSTRFPASSIRDSSQLKGLVKFVQGREWVDFDFLFDGRLPHPGIEWLDGKFKRNIESRLPFWMGSAVVSEIERRFAAEGV